MRFHWFHLMPYPYLPDDFKHKYRSVWVDVPSTLYDPEKGHHLYNQYLDQLEFADGLGFDGICVNEHHQNAYGLMPSPNLMGAALVRRLAESADIVVENFKVGGLTKFGLDAPALRAVNPRLIYASITGFGQDGPYADRAGYDYIIQGMGGLMSITGMPDGEPGGGPMRVGVAVVDLFTGLYTTVAILAALYQREKSGEGAQDLHLTARPPTAAGRPRATA